DVLQYRLEQRLKILAGLLEARGSDSLSGYRVEDRELQLLIVGAQVDVEGVNGIQNLFRPRVLAIDLVDHPYRLEAHLEGLVQHKARRRQRALGGIDQQQHPIDEP